MRLIANTRSGLTTVAVLLCCAATARAETEWPQRGGPHRNFVLTDSEPPAAWTGAGPALLWQRELGPGYSGIVAGDGRLYTMTRRGDQEVMLALSPNTGEMLWEYTYDAKVEANPSTTAGGHDSVDTTWGSGPNGTPLLADGRVVALGFTGIVNCVDAKTGKLLWSHDLQTEYKVQSPFFGHATSPIRYHNTVIVIAGGAHAFDIGSGKRIWENREFAGSYASPILYRRGDEIDLVAAVAGEVVSLDPENGRLRWRYEHANQHRTFLSDVVAGEDEVLLASAYFLGSVGLKVAADGNSVTATWQNPKYQASQTNSVRVDGVVYGFHNSILVAVDVASGEILWRQRGFQRANMLQVGDRFLLFDRNGKLSLVTLDPEGATTHAEVQLLEGRSWTAPTLLGQRLYVRNLETIIAVDLSRSRPTGTESPPRRQADQPVLELPLEFLAARERLMTAYRRSETDSLPGLRAGFERWQDDPAIGHLARYYKGFAAWREALAAGRDGGGGRLLRVAEDEVREAVRLQKNFVEGHALLARIYPGYYRLDPGRAGVVGPLGDEHLDTALRLDPANPRALAIQALDFVYSPPQYGGDPQHGVELMKKALERFEKSDKNTAAGLGWGHATAWLWYGQALQRADAAPEEAAEAFRRALELAPDFAAAKRLLEPEPGAG